MQKEIWKPIKGFEGYRISNLGRVLSTKYREPRILKGGLAGLGYPSVSLWENNKSRAFYVHRLVATAFISNPLCLPEVNHKNGVKTDNRIENLEWVSRQQNQIHSFRTGLSKPYNRKADKNPKARLTWADVEKIRELYKSNPKKYNQHELARIYNIGRASIWKIVHNVQWVV